MKEINNEKCERIYEEIVAKHRTTPTENGVTVWTTGARTIEFELHMMYINHEITDTERVYILGKVCLNAMMNGTVGDFFRIGE